MGDNIRSPIASAIVTAIIACVASIIGAVLAYLAAAHNTSVALENGDLAYRAQMLTVIKDMLPALSDGNKAQFAYPSLYALARDKDKNYKRILMVIGYTSSSDTVQSELAQFIAADPDMPTIRDEDGMKALMTQQARLRAVKIPFAAGGTGTAARARAEVQAPPSPGLAALSKAALPTVMGWVYYGRIGSISRDPGECLPAGTKVPEKASTVTLCSARYVRDSPDPSKGKILSALPATSRVKVENVDPEPLSKASSAVWIQVSPCGLNSGCSP